MTTSKISALTDLGAAPASTDLVPIVDVSDTTQAASGSTKKNLVSDFFSWLLATARTFTAAPVFETGAAGASPVIFRQTGGVAGTDEIQISHNGTDGSIVEKSGNLTLSLTAGVAPAVTLSTAGNFSLGGEGSMQASNVIAKTAFYVGVALDTTLSRVADGVVKFAGSSGAQIELPQSADVGTPSSNSARIGSEDVAGTAEMIVADEAGTETQISEHRSDGPAWLYDDVAVTGMLDRIEYERQRYLGTHRYFNVSRFRRLMAAGTPITSAPGLPTTCEFVETFAQWHARCPEKSHVNVRDWDADQDAKQAAYDAAREAELDKVADIEAAHAAAVAAKQAAATAAYNTAKAEFDGSWLAGIRGIKAPVAPAPLELPPIPEMPAVREAKNIKKPKPSWLK